MTVNYYTPLKSGQQPLAECETGGINYVKNARKYMGNPRKEDDPLEGMEVE